MSSHEKVKMHFIRIENAKRDRSMIKLIVFTERKDEFIMSNKVFFLRLLPTPSFVTKRFHVELHPT